MNYQEVKKIIKDGEAIIILDDDFDDWGIAKILPEGILVTGKTGLSVEGYREGLYPYEDLIFLAQDGFKVEKVAEGDLVPNKKKVSILSIEMDHVASKITERIREAATEKEAKLFQEMLANPEKRDRRLIWGEPILIENVGIYPLASPLLYLVQQGGAQALLSLKADLYL